MDSKDKALKTAVTAIVILAVAMVSYYWVAWRTRKTENDVNLHEKLDTARAQDERNSLAGVYSAVESVEALDRRLGFFSLNRKEDGYFGSAKVDTVASTADASAYMKCEDVKIAEKDFFVKCADPDLGQISYVGEWQGAPGGAIQVTGKLMWIKDDKEVFDKAVTLNRPAQ
jgi:hypothetical protein